MDHAGTGGGLLGADPVLITTLVLNAVTQASHMLLLALGLSLIFGVLRVLNMAHGALHVAGLYVGLSVVQVTGSWWVALFLSPLILAAIGAGLEVALIRPLRNRHPTHALILTFGLILILQDIFKLFWGVDIKLLAEPHILSGCTDGVRRCLSQVLSLQHRGGDGCRDLGVALSDANDRRARDTCGGAGSRGGGGGWRPGAARLHRGLCARHVSHRLRRSAHGHDHVVHTSGGVGHHAVRLRDRGDRRPREPPGRRARIAARWLYRRLRT